MGQLAGAGYGAAVGLEAVLERRLKELIRQQQEQQHAEQIAVQRETLAAAKADRDADNERQRRVVDLAELERTDQQAQRATDRNIGLDAANVMRMPGMSRESQANELQQSLLRNPNAASAPVMLKMIEGLTKVADKKFTSPQRLADGTIAQFEEGQIPTGTRFYQEPKSADAEPLVAVMGTDGVPVFVRRSQAEGRRPANTREQGRPVMVSSAKEMADIDEAIKLSQQLDFKQGDTGIMPGIGAAMPDAVTSLTGFGLEAKKRQGVINLVRQIIGKGLEGGVLRKEDESKYAKILPTLTDPPEVVIAKVENLIATLTQKRDTLLDALTDAGFDTSRFIGRGAPRSPSDAGSGGGDVDAEIAAARARRRPPQR